KDSTIDSIKNSNPGNINQADPVKENIEKSKNVLTKQEKQVDLLKEKIIPVKKEKQINKVSDVVVAKTNRDLEKPVSFQIKSIIDEPKEIKILKDSSVVKINAATKTSDSIEIAAVKIDTATPKEIEKISDSIVKTENKVQKDSIQKSESKTDTMAATKKQPAISKKWKWGVQVTPGISSFVNQAFLFSANKSADFNNSPSSGGVTVPQPARPSKRESGFALQLGGFVKRNISRKAQLSLGLQYSFYSDHILIGGRRDSILNYTPQSMTLNDASRVYGTANSFNNYTNHYHFIELPVELHVQLNKNPDKPFFLDMGFIAGQLISTNALVYDTAFGGIYFDGKKQLNKTQFSLTSGFSWTISSKKILWSIGPLINVHLNRLLDNSFESEKYLFMPGIRTKIIFPGKN
ncbi:MAG TPA: outer membrane beta-barrel protein, partial [Chitinophagaceae bacterium]|nr:outer membrane beta-barrel protein [Chitinophagaceae bacterium]